MRVLEDKDFGKRECPSCATVVLANQNRCPICGYEFPHASPVKRNVKLWGAVVMLVLFVMLVLGLM